MDEFDFDEIEDANNKKPTNKTNQKHPTSKPNKSNSKNDDFFDFQVTQKPKNIQSIKKSNFDYNNLDSYLDENEKKQTTKKISQKNKENETTLPRITISKSPQNKEQKSVKNKMDLSLEELPEKRVMVQKDQKKVKKASQDFEYDIDGTESRQNNGKSQLKTNIVGQKQVKQEKKQAQVKTSPKNISKTIQVVPKKNKSPQKPKLEQKKKHTQIEDDEYAEEYEQEIQQQPQKKYQPNNKKAEQQKSPKPLQKKQEKAKNQLPKKEPTKQVAKKEPTKQVAKKEPIKQEAQKESKPQTRSKGQKQAPINRYKQMVQKAFPQDLDEQKAKKQKPDALNRLNDKIREMIKGFSGELTDLIDKNLLLLRKPQNEIKQQIQGQPLDPVQAHIKVLEESKKNNQKMLQISEKQLQSTIKMNQKIQQSVSTNIQVTQQLQTFKKHIALIGRQISNLKNQIQKEGKKVVKMQENNTSDQPGGKFKSSLQVSQKLANAKLQYQKQKKKLQELNQKQRSLQQKIHQITYKKTQALQKASTEGISFCSKQEKKRYEQLKKKHDQLVLFESKFKSSIKSKQSIIQHEMTDLQVLIADYEKKFDILNDQAYVSRQKIFGEITKAKKNPKINSNTKEILAQLQTFMNDDNLNQQQQQLSSLNYLSQNIYKKQYQTKTNSRPIPSQKQLKKAAYKNYIQEVARINGQNKAKITSQRRNSQINPFRKALTPGETTQANQARDKMNKTKDNKVQLDKQKQRVWKSSNTQAMIRNPLKKQINKQRYPNPVEQDNPLSNKEIIKLIDKNKDKIILKQEENIQKTQQSSGNIKKPFTFRASLKEKQLQQNVNALAQIPDQMKQIQKSIEIRRNQHIKKEAIEQKEQPIPVKLKDKQQEGLQLTLQLKPANNNTPFRNFKLKKDKDKQAETAPSESKFKLQPEKAIQKIPEKPLSIPQNIPAPQIQQQSTFKPKRFNLRQKKQTSDNAGYMPSSVNTQKPTAKQSQIPFEKPNQKEPHSQFNVQQNKFRISDPVKKKQEEAFDPFKKFMANPTTDDKPFSLAADNKNDRTGIKLTTNDDPPVINTKPRLNLFKKGAAQSQEPEKKQQIVLKDVKKQQGAKSQQQNFVNPYAKPQGPKQQGIKVQRQGRVKKMNPAGNSIKGGNKNIFGDVEDATSNNILSLGEPQSKPQQQAYVPKTISNEKEVNVNDLLGIKKKNVEIDRDLLIDLPSSNKIGIKAKAGGKAGDFFGDMDL